MVHSLGNFALGIKGWNHVLRTHPTPQTIPEYANLTIPEQAPYKVLAKGQILGRLIIRNSLNNLFRKMLEESYSINITLCYPNNKGDRLNLLASLSDDSVVIAIHGVLYPNYE